MRGVVGTWLMVSCLAVTPSAQAVQQYECKDYPDGSRRCTPTSGTPTNPPTRIREGVPVNGRNARDTRPKQLGTFLRSVWDSYNRQTTSWMPTLHDAGSVGTEGNDGLDPTLCRLGADMATGCNVGMPTTSTVA